MTQCIILTTPVKIPNGSYSANTWSAVGGFSVENFDVGTLSAVPALTGDITAIMEFASNATGAQYGIQNGSDTANIVLTGALRSTIHKFIKLTGSNTIDAFLTNTTNGEWFLKGYTNHITYLASPVDKGGTTGAGTFTIDCSADVPTGAISGSVLIECSANVKVGASANITTQPSTNATPRNHLIVPLDASRQFFINSSGVNTVSGDIRILGWLAPDAASFETTFTQLSHAGNSAWADSGRAAVTTVFDRWQVFSGSDSVLANIRTGSSSYNVVDKNMGNRTRWAAPSAGGLIDSWANNSAAKFIRFMGLVGNTVAASISSIDTFVAGATATVVFDQSVTSITRLRVKTGVTLADGVTPIDTHYIDITSFSGSGTTWTFTVPTPTDATDGIRLGALIITPTTNTGVGTDFTTAVYSKTGYSSVNIETPASGNICEGDIPALAMDDQIGYQYGSVSVNGIYSDPTASFSGTQTIFHYAVSDFKWYTFTLTTGSGGGGGGTGGLTSSGLTTSGLTRAGLTSVGL